MEMFTLLHVILLLLFFSIFKKISFFLVNTEASFAGSSFNIGDPNVKEVWIKRGFPVDGFVSAIAIDPADADNVIVAFANYNIQSLFSTTNGGNTWTPISGNLEEYPNGKGSGPSCRTAATRSSVRL